MSSGSTETGKGSTFKSWRNAVLGTLIVLSGLGAAAMTVLARRAGDWEMARLGAITSLVFVVLIVVFVVPPLTRSARAEVAQFDLPFQVAPGGIIFICIFLIVAFAAWNTGNNLLFLIFSLLASMLFVGWAAARASLRDMMVTARFPDHIFAGEPAPVIVTLHNRKRVLPSFSVLVEARSRAGDDDAARRKSKKPRTVKGALAYFMYVPHGAKVEQRVEQVFAERGRLLVTGFDISTGFPFGFFRLRRRLHARDVELVIYPKPERASDDVNLLPMDAGLKLATVKRGAGADLHSMRDYQPQDDMRHIDWKATARMNRLIVREFMAEDERRVHIAFDTFIDSREATAVERFERGVMLAASLVTHFIDEKAELRLTLGDEAGRYGTGREHLYATLRRLALVAPVPLPGDSRTQMEIWERIAPPSRAERDNYVILLTTAPRGSIPAHIWRKSHVIHLEASPQPAPAQNRKEQAPAG